MAFNSLLDEDPIKKSIINAVKDLKQNAFSGIQIPKRLFPKEYILKYHIVIFGNMIYLKAGEFYIQ